MLGDLDFFDFFRLVLAWVASIYAIVITLQSLWGWYVWLATNDKYIGLMRRYLIVHGLRLRFRAFWGDVLVSLLLCITFLILWHAHGKVEQLKLSLDRLHQPVKWNGSATHRLASH